LGRNKPNKGLGSEDDGEGKVPRGTKKEAIKKTEGKRQNSGEGGVQQTKKEEESRGGIGARRNQGKVGRLPDKHLLKQKRGKKGSAGTKRTFKKA